MPRRKPVRVPDWRPFHGCEACRGSGWVVTVPSGWERKGYAYTRVARCVCWRAYFTSISSRNEAGAKA